MCGIVGFFGSTDVDPYHHLEGMSAALERRGPDGEGMWVDRDLEIALGHRRLTIVDLTVTGAQPMRSKDGRYIIVFNGEIYNHKELRKRHLSGSTEFRGTSDTEVLLACVQEWGLEGALSRLVGMFAFVLVDLGEQRAFLVRDRMGEKPLYYGQQGQLFCFASEPAGIVAHSGWRAEIDPVAVNQLVLYGRIPAPLSIYQSVEKLEPGCMMDLRRVQGQWRVGKVTQWWDYQTNVATQISRNSIAPGLVVDEVESILGTTISGQMEADVPVGAFLSGGIDSSTIVAIASAQSSDPIHTFTVGFESDDYDESDQARAIAKHLGTKHHELLVSPNNALKAVESLPSIYSEPFADSSQIPTALIAQFASEHVKVVMSGDGGDEVFGGYNRYIWAPRVRQISRFLPGSMKKFLNKKMFSGAIPSRGLVYLLEFIARLVSVRQSDEKIQKALVALLASSEGGTYEQLMRTGPVAHLLAPHENSLEEKSGSKALGLGESFAERMQHRDATGYLPDDILVKVDRASMAYSLETRLPFLDHRLIEFMGKVPITDKIDKAQRKKILRQLSSRYLPQGLMVKGKSGFAVPVGEWLRGPLKAWGNDLLSESQLNRQGFLDTIFVRDLWDQHQRRAWDHTATLWAILMLQQWLQFNKR
jgi:asparagine synthase (glutamine-hydrolysing)